MDDEPGNEPRLREPRVTGRSTARVITLHGRGEYATFIVHERPSYGAPQCPVCAGRKLADMVKELASRNRANNALKGALRRKAKR